MHEFAAAKRVAIICGDLSTLRQTFGAVILQCVSNSFALVYSKNYDCALTEATINGQQAMYSLTGAATAFLENLLPLP